MTASAPHQTSCFHPYPWRSPPSNQRESVKIKVRSCPSPARNPAVFPCHSKDRLKSLNGLTGPAQSGPWLLPDPTLSFSPHSLSFSHTDIFPVPGVPQVCSCLRAWHLLFPLPFLRSLQCRFLISFRVLIRCHLLKKLSLTRVLILPSSMFLANPFLSFSFLFSTYHHLTFVCCLSLPVK